MAETVETTQTCMEETEDCPCPKYVIVYQCMGGKILCDKLRNYIEVIEVYKNPETGQYHRNSIDSDSVITNPPYYIYNSSTYGKEFKTFDEAKRVKDRDLEKIEEEIKEICKCCDWIPKGEPQKLDCTKDNHAILDLEHYRTTPYTEFANGDWKLEANKYNEWHDQHGAIDARGYIIGLTNPRCQGHNCEILFQLYLNSCQ